MSGRLSLRENPLRSTTIRSCKKSISGQIPPTDDPTSPSITVKKRECMPKKTCPHPPKRGSLREIFFPFLSCKSHLSFLFSSLLLSFSHPAHPQRSRPRLSPSASGISVRSRATLHRLAQTP